MNITPKKEFEYDTLWFLRTIESNLINDLNSNKVEFPFTNPAGYFSKIGVIPSHDRQKAVINYLEKERVLKFEKGTESIIMSPNPITLKEMLQGVPNTFPSRSNYKIEVKDKKDFLILNKKRFDEIYIKYQKLIEKQQLEDILVKELVIGSLVYNVDGGIYFRNKLIKMRPQIHNLCVLFMKNHKKLVDYSTIKDELIDAKKRSLTDFKTITKYVNELHKLLRKYFKKDVLFNQEKNAYIFDIGTSS